MMSYVRNSLFNPIPLLVCLEYFFLLFVHTETTQVQEHLETDTKGKLKQKQCIKDTIMLQQ